MRAPASIITQTQKACSQRRWRVKTTRQKKKSNKQKLGLLYVVSQDHFSSGAPITPIAPTAPDHFSPGAPIAPIAPIGNLVHVQKFEKVSKKFYSGVE